MQIPSVTPQQMAEVDRLMVEEYGIQLMQMMENAGRNLAEVGRRMLGGEVRGKRIALLCGPGNNGGGGLVAARHLHNWGAEISLKILPKNEKLKIMPRRQFHILEKMGIFAVETMNFEQIDLIIDAILGYGLAGDPSEPTAHWILQANDAGRPVLALDAPSGLDMTTGILRDPCIRATATMTLALPKTGLFTPDARKVVGDLYLADISVPRQLYSQLGIEVPPIFIHDSIIKI